MRALGEETRWHQVGLLARQDLAGQEATETLDAWGTRLGHAERRWGWA